MHDWKPSTDNQKQPIQKNETVQDRSTFRIRMETAIATKIESFAVPGAASAVDGVEDGEDGDPNQTEEVIEVFTLSLRGATGTSADLSLERGRVGVAALEC